MKNIKKILPAIAAAGVIGVLGASNASAYNYSQQLGYQGGTYDATVNPNNVEICYTVSGIMTPFATTYTIPMSVTSSSSINLGNVTATSAADTTYTSSGATSGNFTIAFNEDGTQNTVTKCVHLNFASALDRAAAFDTHVVNMGTPTSSNANAPVDDEAGKQITFGYQLATDSAGSPKTQSGVYLAEYWTKGEPEYESEIARVNTHIEVTKTVKGNAAEPQPSNRTGEDGFIFKARVAKKYSTIPDTAYNIYVNGRTLKTCSFATSMTDASKDCEFRLNHGETAYIGCSGSNCQTSSTLPLNAIEYSITESDTKSHTPYVDGATSSSNTTGTQQLDTENKSHAFVNEKTNTIAGRFFNIVPFIILAILATVGVVTLRKANKKHEA